MLIVYVISYFISELQGIVHGATSGEMVVAYRKLENEPSQIIIDEDSKEQLIAVGYARSYVKTFFFHLVALALFGLPYVLTYWHDVFRVRWQYVQCPVAEAEVLVLEVFFH